MACRQLNKEVWDILQRLLSDSRMAIRFDEMRLASTPSQPTA